MRNQRGEIIGAFEVLNKTAGGIQPARRGDLLALGLACRHRHRDRAIGGRTAPQPGRTGAAERALVARGGEQVFESRPHWNRATDTAGDPVGGTNSGQHGERVDHGRERNGEGDGGQGDPLHQPARAAAVRSAELRGASRDAGRERAFRDREGRRHRRQLARRAVPEGGRRHAVSGRDWRPEPGGPGQDSARAAGARGGAPGRARRAVPWTCGC